MNYLELVDKRNCIDGIDLMNMIPDNAISACIADFQYRGVLEKLSYGNEGQRQVGRSELQQMPEELIAEFCQKIARVLRPSGHMFLWIDKFHLVQASALEWTDETNLTPVGLITWDKKSFGMGYRTRASSEYLLVFQKEPLRAKGVWTDRAIRDIWAFEHEEEMSSVLSEKIPLPRSGHPHRKPVGLTSRLIMATTLDGDLVLDPCAGSFNTLYATAATGRRFIGGDIDPELCE